MKRILLAALVALVALGATGLAQALGTRDRPITMLFVPSTNVAVIQEVAPKIAEALSKITGLVIRPVIAADYSAMIEAMIAAKGDTFGIPATDQYVRITDANPGVHARLASVRNGYTYYFASIYALREAGYTSINDLQNKVWLFASRRSASGYVIPSGFFKAEGVVTVEKDVGSHTKAMIALLEGQGDFCTGYGSPPLPPAGYEGPKWDLEAGMDPDLWLWDKETNGLVPEGERGECRDVRWAIATETKVYGDIWQLVEKIGVVATVGPIPNDCIAFSAGFPEGLENRIVTAIIQHIATPEGFALWSRPGFYEWSNVMLVEDSYYDGYRSWVGLKVPER